MKLKYILGILLLFCVACASRVFTSTPMNQEFTSRIGDPVMKWQILKRGRITDQRLVYAGQRNGLTAFYLYTQKPGKGITTKTLTYDLRVSPYVNYKSATIQVIKVTPNYIRYIAKTPFLGRQDSFSN